MNFPKELKYSKSHEWVRIEGEKAFVGLTDYAQSELGDLVFVNLPEPGDKLNAGDVLGDVESVKAVSDIYTPIGGTVVAINEDLLDAPQKMNESPYEAWLIELDKTDDSEELLSDKEYEEFIKTL